MSSKNTLQHRAECAQTCAGLLEFVLKAQLPPAVLHVDALVTKYLPGCFSVFEVHIRGRRIK
jgi:hypothetical protein